MRLQSLICGSRDELRWHLRRPGGQVDQRRCLCPLQCLVDRADVCITTVQAAQAAPSTPYPNPPQPLPPSHTNGVFAWLVNRADCSHLTAFRFKYLSVSWWAKSALTVRLLFKVADRRLGEREREREGGKKHPSLAGEMGFISMCSYSVMVTGFFFFFTLNRCIRQATSALSQQCISILALPQWRASTERITSGLKKKQQQKNSHCK